MLAKATLRQVIVAGLQICLETYSEQYTSSWTHGTEGPMWHSSCSMLMILAFASTCCRVKLIFFLPVAAGSAYQCLH